MFRELEIIVVTTDDLESDADKRAELVDWQEAVGDTELQSVTLASFGLAEEVIGLLELGNGLWEVGVGESLRPYDLKWRGRDAETAKKYFWDVVTHAVTDWERP